MPYNALVFTLRSQVELNWTRAIRHVIAQSVQFSKTAKKLNIDLCQRKGSTVRQLIALNNLIGKHFYSINTFEIH